VVLKITVFFRRNRFGGGATKLRRELLTDCRDIKNIYIFMRWDKKTFDLHEIQIIKYNLNLILVYSTIIQDHQVT